MGLCAKKGAPSAPCGSLAWVPWGTQASSFPRGSFKRDPGLGGYEVEAASHVLPKVGGDAGAFSAQLPKARGQLATRSLARLEGSGRGERAKAAGGDRVGWWAVRLTVARASRIIVDLCWPERWGVRVLASVGDRIAHLVRDLCRHGLVTGLATGLRGARAAVDTTSQAWRASHACAHRSEQPPFIVDFCGCERRCERRPGRRCLLRRGSYQRRWRSL